MTRVIFLLTLKADPGRQPRDIFLECAFEMQGFPTFSQGEILLVFGLVVIVDRCSRSFGEEGHTYDVVLRDRFGVVEEYLDAGWARV